MTNFEMSRYDVESIMKNCLPVGGSAKRSRHSLESEHNNAVVPNHNHPSLYPNVNVINGGSSTINFSPIQPALAASIPCAIPFDSAPPHFHQNLLHHFYPTRNGTGVAGQPTAAASGTELVPLSAPMAAAPEFFLWSHQPC